MARIRTIKPEFWTHEDLSAQPEATHMLAAALLNHADDEGYFNANPGLVRAACCPLREPSVSVQDSLKRLVEIGYLRMATAPDGKRYGYVVTFDDHQRVNRPTPSKIKGLGLVWDESLPTHTQLSEDSPPERNREQGKEQGKEEKPSSSAAPSDAPTDLDAKRKERAERLSQITDDAITAYNSILAKPKGLLAAVSVKVGREKRRDQVAKCLRVVRQICDENYGSSIITAQFWQEYFTECAADDFLCGAGPYSGAHANWRPDFEFLTREATVLKVYDRAASEDAA